jgi:hypothetical protein
MSHFNRRKSFLHPQASDSCSALSTPDPAMSGFPLSAVALGPDRSPGFVLKMVALALGKEDIFQLELIQEPDRERALKTVPPKIPPDFLRFGAPICVILRN